MRRIGVDERRARLAVRHHLATAARAVDVAGVAGDLVGLHATDPGSVYFSAAARLKTFEVGTLERALYDDRSLVRILGMRRTMFVVPLELAPIVHAAATRALFRNERKRTIDLVEGAGLAADGARWLRAASDQTMKALDACGEATASELAKDVPALRARIAFGEGKKSAGEQGMTTRVLFLLAAEGRIVRGRPRGSWLSSQYRWSPMDAWVPGGLGELDTTEARVDLARRWLYAFGPATVADIKWWTGLTLGDVKKALAVVDPVEVDLDGAPGLVLRDDVDEVKAPKPWVALLPALDPTVMGWTGRDWYLGAHRPLLFDRSGNAGPTVWSDGRVVGGWAQRPDGDVVVRLLEDVGRETRVAIDAEVERTMSWLEGVRVIPRFRTPLERELSA